MDYHQNARLTIHSREQLARRVLEQGCTLKLAGKWARRYREHGLGGLKDRSSRPDNSPRRTPSCLLEKVFALLYGKCPNPFSPNKTFVSATRRTITSGATSG
jgi:hypothetical protein